MDCFEVSFNTMMEDIGIDERDPVCFRVMCSAGEKPHHALACSVDAVSLQMWPGITIVSCKLAWVPCCGLLPLKRIESGTDNRKRVV